MLINIIKKIVVILFLINSLLSGSESTPTQEEISKLYVATFNRAPDSGGLEYWVGSGLKLSQIAQSFFDQPETQLLYPTDTSNVDFINSVYQNLFNRVPDNEGLNYWDNELNRGAFSKNSFIQAVINGALDTEESKDATILNNKNEVGLHFALANLSDTIQAKIVLNGITDSALSVSFIKNKITSNIINVDIWNEFVPESLSTAEAFSDIQKEHFKSIIDIAFNAKVDKAGMSVAIYNGKDIYKYALGKASESISMDVETPVRLYSISKSITSTEVLKLVDSGSLSLTDTVASALSGYSGLSSFDTSKINMDATIIELLNHTSGIRDYAANDSGVQSLVMSAMFGQVWKPSALIGLLQEDFSNVGEYFYSGTNYILLGMIIENKTGLNLNQQLQNDIFSNIGGNIVLPPQDTTLSSLAKPYDDRSAYGAAAEFGTLLDLQPFFTTAVNLSGWSAHGIIATAQSIAEFGYGTYSEYGNLLSSSMRTQLLNSTDEGIDNYGYGVSRETMELNGNIVYIYGHGGGGLGYLTILYYSPDTDLSIAILTNNNSSLQNSNINTFDGNDLYDICVKLFNSLEE